MTQFGQLLQLARMTHLDVARYLKSDDRILVPFGSLEQNGPHLPLGSDTIVAQTIAERVSIATGVIVAPAIPWGNAAADMSFKGTISLGSGLLTTLLEQLCLSLKAHGFRRFVFVTGHLANVYTFASVAPELNRRGLVMAQVDVWRLMQKLCGDLFGSKALAYGHASVMMTSALLALDACVVATRELSSALPTPGWAGQTYSAYPDIMGFAPWEQLSQSGLVGDSRGASASLGEAALARVIEKTIELTEAIRSATPREC
jgi:creatinine amidohydrolase